MANEFIEQLRPRDFFRQNGMPLNEVDLVQAGVLPAVPLYKGDTSGLTAVLVVPANLTVATGFVFQFGLVDDGANALDPGKVVRIGITVKKLVGGTDNLTLTGAATEQTVDVTLDATSGEVVLGSLSIANANLDSTGTGDTCLVRIRRIGTASQDTAPGCVLLTHLYVRNT